MEGASTSQYAGNLRVHYEPNLQLLLTDDFQPFEEPQENQCVQEPLSSVYYERPNQPQHFLKPEPPAYQYGHSSHQYLEQPQPHSGLLNYNTVGAEVTYNNAITRNKTERNPTPQEQDLARESARRLRNRMAARRYRQRKKEYMQNLERELEAYKVERGYLYELITKMEEQQDLLYFWLNHQRFPYPFE